MGDDSYPLYRRRSPQDGGQTFIKYNRGQAVVFDNRWVVPYNAYLLLRYNAHVNVEYMRVGEGGQISLQIHLQGTRSRCGRHFTGQNCARCG